jgi:rhomboid protease GluP
LPQRLPFVTYTLIILTVLVFLAQLGTEALLGEDIPFQFGVKYNPLIDAGQYWRLFTPTLLHADILHIGFNMYALYLLGRELERFYGHWRFLLLYLLGGFTGALASYLFTPHPSLGASTATFGLLGAYGILAFRNQRIFGPRSRLILRNVIQIGIINLLLGLSPSIDNWAHLGGALGGVALAWFGGPEFHLSGSMVDIQLENKRTAQQFLLVFLVLFVLAASIAVTFPGAVQFNQL